MGGITILSEICAKQDIANLISICKSDSGVAGASLRNAHQSLGSYLGELISSQEKDANRFAAIILMRAGLPFGMGIADALDAGGKNIKVFFSTKEKVVPDGLSEDSYDRTILVDAVIESGNSILELADKMKCQKKIILATNVISCKSVAKFENHNLYTIRVSQKSFKGSMQKEVSNGKGPDTGERLFDSHFYKTPISP